MKINASDEFIDRIVKSYRITSDGFENERGHIWQAIDGLRLPIHNMLISADRDGIRNMLEDPVTTDLFYGMDNLAFSLTRKTDDGSAEQLAEDEAYSASVEGQLYLLGEAFGVRRTVLPISLEYFLMNNPSDVLLNDVDVILSKIQNVCKFDIAFPAPFNREKGKNTIYGLCSFRSAAALYQAYRIQQEIGVKTAAKLLEVGPGMGRTIYYAHKSGIQCTTIDLPLGIVAQACFLSANFGPDAIWMTGDTVSDKGRIRLLPTSALTSLAEHFDLALNVDSLTEMSFSDASACTSWINEHCRTFLSINHDCNKFCASDFIRSNMETEYHARFIYRFLEGHTEEIVRMRQPVTPKLNLQKQRDDRGLTGFFARLGSLILRFPSTSGKSHTK